RRFERQGAQQHEERFDKQGEKHLSSIRTVFERRRRASTTTKRPLAPLGSYHWHRTRMKSSQKRATRDDYSATCHYDSLGAHSKFSAPPDFFVVLRAIVITLNPRD